MQTKMKHRAGLIGLLALAGCSDAVRDPVTLDCDVEVDGTAQPSIRGVLHFEDRFLFIQAADGGADNVCSRTGTTECTVTRTRQKLSLDQDVELPGCYWRRSVHVSLRVDLQTGAFRLLEEGCEPSEDITYSGTCKIR